MGGERITHRWPDLVTASGVPINWRAAKAVPGDEGSVAVKDPVTALLVVLALASCSGGIGQLPVDNGNDAGPGSDAGSCLEKVPASCPDCVTQNAGDAVVCRLYLQCFATCNPSQPCAAPDGVCGVNTLGGGTAPYMAAVTTYRCACP